MNNISKDDNEKNNSDLCYKSSISEKFLDDDETFLIIDGRSTLKYNNEELTVKRSDYVIFPKK